jgi:sigma-B regulation protein RsbU (phosphoserine phosphatase)
MRGYVALRPGDVLILYTDGVSEASDPADQEFGVGRIRDLVVENAARPAADIADRIFTAVQDHSGLTTPRDDQTVVVVRAR